MSANAVFPGTRRFRCRLHQLEPLPLLIRNGRSGERDPFVRTLVACLIEAHDENVGVYCTVFSSSSEVVAVGFPRDGGGSHHDLSNFPPNKAKPVSQKPSFGALGKLSRKSEEQHKWDHSESECVHEKVMKDEGLCRSSLPAYRLSSVPGKHRRNLGLLTILLPPVGRFGS